MYLFKNDYLKIIEILEHDVSVLKRDSFILNDSKFNENVVNQIADMTMLKHKIRLEMGVNENA